MNTGRTGVTRGIAALVAGLLGVGGVVTGPAMAASAAVDLASTSWLTSDFNASGFGDPGTSNGDMDGDGAFLPRTKQADMGLVPNSALTTQGLAFTIGGGTSGASDHIRAAGQVIDTSDALGAGAVTPATTIAFVGAGVGKTQTDQTAILTLDDESTQTATFTLTDWCASSAAGTNVAVGTKVARWNSGGQQTATCGLWATAPVSITAGRTVESITLPNNSGVRIFAIASNANTANAVVSADEAPALSAATLVVGQRVTASIGTAGLAAGADLQLEWLLDGTTVAAWAGKDAITPGGWDEGKALSVRALVLASGHRPAVSPVSSAVTIGAGSIDIAVPAAVTGTNQVGQELAVVDPVAVPAAATTAATWRLDGQEAGQGPTFTPALSAAGKELSVEVSANARGYASESQVITVGRVAGLDFAAATPPVLAGAAVVGQELSVAAGVYTVVGTTSTYEWLRDGAVIAGQVGSSYTIVAADAGHRVGVRVTATAVGYEPVVTLVTTDVVATAAAVPTPGTPSVIVTPPTTDSPTSVLKVAKPVVRTKKGKAVKKSTQLRRGTVLRVRRPSVTGKGATAVKIAYQWLRSGKTIKGATKKTYKVKAKDRGKKLSVRVTVSASGFSAVSKTSAKTGAVRR